MRNGDLSNKVSPRIYIVFEDLVASIPEGRKEEYSDLISGRKVDWFKAIRCYKTNTLVCDRINWLAWNKDINITIVTWMGKDSLYGIDNFLSECNVLAGVMESSVDSMIEELIHRPDVVAIYDPDPAHILTFGSKCIWVKNPDDIGRVL